MATKYLISKEQHLTLIEKKHNLEKITLAKIRQEKRHAIDTGGGTHDNASYEALLIDEDLATKQINDLNSILNNFAIIDYEAVTCDEVRPGTKVELFELEINSLVTYLIVGAFDTSIKDGKIAYDTPIGKQLMGMRVNEKRKIVLPNGTIKYFRLNKIEKI